MHMAMEDFEKELVHIMMDEDCTISEALQISFDMNGVDTKSVVDLVDFLEYRTNDLDTVEYMMNIYTGNSPDMRLNPL